MTRIIKHRRAWNVFDGALERRQRHENCKTIYRVLPLVRAWVANSSWLKDQQHHVRIINFQFPPTWCSCWMKNLLESVSIVNGFSDFNWIYVAMVVDAICILMRFPDPSNVGNYDSGFDGWIVREGKLRRRRFLSNGSRNYGDLLQSSCPSADGGKQPGNAAIS